MPKRKRYLFVCTNRREDGNPKSSCAQKGSEAIHAALKTEVGKQGLAIIEARACTASCLDICHEGPVIAIEPDHAFYGNVTLNDVKEIVEALAQDRLVDRLLIQADQFDAKK